MLNVHLNLIIQESFKTACYKALALSSVLKFSEKVTEQTKVHTIISTRTGRKAIDEHIDAGGEIRQRNT